MKTILVVDDEFGLADALRSALTDEGYRVVTAANGRQGVTALGESTPDLVLLDFMMPVLDGPGLYRVMKADPRWRDVPVIFMSAVNQNAIDAECPDYVAFLRKPFDLASLLRVVQRAIGPPDKPPAP